MKTRYFYSIAFLILTISSIAQVGINKTNPRVALDVIGSVKTDGNLYLENPNHKLEIRDSKLLARKSNGEIIRYDISASKYGPINFVEFIFENVSANGLLNYNTKIDADDYLVAIQGFSFFRAGDSDPNIVLQSDNNIENIEGHQIYAYKNPITNTWFLKAFAKDSRFRKVEFGSVVDTLVDMHLNLVIYRNHFISKEQNTVTVSLNNTETATAPLPPGF